MTKLILCCFLLIALQILVTSVKMEKSLRLEKVRIFPILSLWTNNENIAIRSKVRDPSVKVALTADLQTESLANTIIKGSCKARLLTISESKYNIPTLKPSRSSFISKNLTKL